MTGPRRHQQKRPELRERAEIFSLRLSPRLNKRSRSCAHLGLRADRAKPPQRKLDVLHQTARPIAKDCRWKKAFMLSVHNETPMRHRPASFGTLFQRLAAAKRRCRCIVASRAGLLLL